MRIVALEAQIGKTRLGMRINRLYIKNFKGFEDKAFEFTEQFTVLIGDNGKGKTTAMEALAVAAAAYLLGIEGAPNRHIQKEDIFKKDFGDHFEPQTPVEIIAEGEIDSQSIRWSRKLSSFDGRTNTKDAAPIIEIASQHQDQIRKGIRVALPVLAFYGTGRLWVEKKKRIDTKSKGSILLDGYYACLEPKSTNTEFLEWYYTYELSIVTKQKEASLLYLVRDAISSCIENWTDIRFDFEENDLVGKRTSEDGEKHRIPFHLLSDGQRNIVGLVAELAYRCITLNGHLGTDAIKESRGIVLIDEIDQHLHPNWQKRIVSDLKRTFPNIQFIATTHSPFIVQSLRSKELINLDNMSGKVDEPLRHSIEDIAETAMGVPLPQRSKHFMEMQRAAETYFSLLREGKAEAEEVKKQLDELEALFSTDPAYVALLKIERKIAKM